MCENTAFYKDVPCYAHRVWRAYGVVDVDNLHGLSSKRFLNLLCDVGSRAIDYVSCSQSLTEIGVVQRRSCNDSCESRKLRKLYC